METITQERAGKQQASFINFFHNTLNRSGAVAPRTVSRLNEHVEVILSAPLMIAEHRPRMTVLRLLIEGKGSSLVAFMPPRPLDAPLDSFIGQKVSVRLMGSADKPIEGTIFTYVPDKAVLVLAQNIHSEFHGIKIINLGFVTELKVIPSRGDDDQLPLSSGRGAVLPLVQVAVGDKLSKFLNKRLKDAERKRYAITGADGEDSLDATLADVPVIALDIFDELSRVCAEVVFVGASGTVSVGGGGGKGKAASASSTIPFPPGTIIVSNQVAVTTRQPTGQTTTWLSPFVLRLNSEGTVSVLGSGVPDLQAHEKMVIGTVANVTGRANGPV